MDENERIALQEQEDERLARELEARERSGGNLEVWPECLLVHVAIDQ